jgi:hypothetical protein
MLVDHSGTRIMIDMDSYCVDGIGLSTENFSLDGLDYSDYIELANFSGHERDQTAIICYPENTFKDDPEVNLF